MCTLRRRKRRRLASLPCHHLIAFNFLFLLRTKTRGAEETVDFLSGLFGFCFSSLRLLDVCCCFAPLLSFMHKSFFKIAGLLLTSTNKHNAQIIAPRLVSYFSSRIFVLMLLTSRYFAICISVEDTLWIL